MIIPTSFLLILVVFGKEFPYVVGEEVPKGSGAETSGGDGGETTGGDGGETSGGDGGVITGGDGAETTVGDGKETNGSDEGDNSDEDEEEVSNVTVTRTGVDDLKPVIEPKFKNKGTLKEEYIPGYSVNGDGFYFMIRRYEWHHKTPRTFFGVLEHTKSAIYTTGFVHRYEYRNIIELYYNKIFLLDFVNNDILKVRKEVRLRVPKTTTNAVVPVVPKDPQAPGEFQVFFNVNGSCFNVKIQDPQGRMKLSRSPVDCSLMEENRRKEVATKEE